MKPIEKLSKVSAFLRNLNVSAVNAIFTTGQADATKSLSTAVGSQIVTSRPELHHSSGTSTIEAVIFVLDKDLGNGKTPAAEDEQYSDLLNMVDGIIYRINNAIESPGCNSSLLGLQLTDYSIVPETSLFGGWIGWSIDITFE